MAHRITGFKSLNFLSFYSAALILGIIFKFVGDQGVTAAPVNIQRRAINRNIKTTVINDNTFTLETYLNTKLVHQTVTKHIEEHVSQVMSGKDHDGSLMLPKFERSIVDGAAYTWEY